MSNHKQLNTSLVLAAMALSLTACGGGGGGDDGPSANPPASGGVTSPAPAPGGGTTAPAPAPGTGTGTGTGTGGGTTAPAPAPGTGTGTGTGTGGGTTAPAPAPGTGTGTGTGTGGGTTAPAPAPGTGTGTGTGTGGGTTAPAPAVIASNIQTSAPASTYPAGSAEKAGFDLLNAERSRCGFGLLRQSTQVDMAAADHSRWMALNQTSSHVQDGAQFPNGFTGRTATDRARFRGYTNAFVGEDYVYASNLPDRLAETGASRMRSLLNAPFHLGSLMGPNRDIGFGFVSRGSQGFTDNSRFLTPYVVKVATKMSDSFADVASNQVVTYPCEGTTGVFPGLFGEDPNPLPGRDLATNPAGLGILVRTRINTALFLTTARVREVGTSTDLPIASILTSSSPIPVISGSAVIIPDKPLKDNTRYTVTISGEANRLPFSRTFTFTTGAFFQ